MKKLTLWLAAALAVVMGLFCLSACKETEEEEVIDYTGTYKVQTATVDYNGISATLDLNDTFTALLFSWILTEDSFTATLNEDGSLVLYLNFILEITVTDASWKVNEEDEKKLDVTIMGEKQTVDCDGKTIAVSFTPMSGFTISGTMKK